MPFEDNTSAPPLVEILVQVLRIDLADEEVDARLEDGRILLGYYASREGRDISVHSLPESHDVPVPVRKRLKEVFGTELSDAVKMDTQIEVQG